MEFLKKTFGFTKDKKQKPNNKQNEKVNVQDTFSFNDYNVEVTINELYSETKSTFKVTNENKTTSLEIDLLLPISEKTIMQRFEAVCGEERIKSKIFKKEKAEEKYSDSVAQGNTAILSSLSEDKKAYKVFLGLLKPNSQLELTLYTTTLNGIEDKSFCYSYNPAHFPMVNNKNLRTILKDTPSINFKLSALVITKSQITRLICPSLNSQDLMTSFSNDNKICDVSFSEKIKSSLDGISLLFRTKKSSDFRIYEEFDSKLNEYSYNFSFLIDKYNNIKEGDTDKVDTDNKKVYSKLDDNILNDYPGNFTFLIDQSGSMSGSSMELAKEALILFIKSLPSYSKFSIVGFGTSHTIYFDKMEYNEKNINESINLISSLKANLGGTNIYDPLAAIFVKEDISYDFLPKYVYVLTDGAVSDSNRVINLIKENRNEFSITSIGIGTSVDTNFVTNMGKVGQGFSYIVPNVVNLKQIVIKALNDSLKPYLTDIKLEFPDNFLSNKILDFPSLKSHIKKQDEVFFYSVITSKKLELGSLIKFSYKDNSLEEICSQEIILNEDNLITMEGNSLNKLIVGLKFNNNTKTDFSSEEKAKFGVKYQVLIPETALFAEIENTDTTKESKLIKVDAKKTKSYGQINLEEDLKIPEYNTFNGVTASYNFSSCGPQLRSSGINSNLNLSSITLNKSINNREQKTLFMDKLVKSKKNSVFTKSLKKEVAKSEKNILRNRKLEDEEEDEDVDDDLKNDCIERYEKLDKQNNSLMDDINLIESSKINSISCCPTSSNNNNNNNIFNCPNVINVPSLAINTINKNAEYNDDLFKSIIVEQGFDGIWKSNCSFSEIIEFNYNKKKMSLLNLLQSNNNEKLANKELLNNVITTIILLIILNEKYPSKKEEFKLMENKSKKALTKLGIKYDDILKAL